jgi:hypothetical protein
MSFFVRHAFAHETDNKPYFKFNMTKGRGLIYRMVPRGVDVGGWIAIFMATEVSRCFGDLV